MQVILLERVQNLGELGDSVKVKPGYARNYLIPKGRAVIATAENVAEFEARRADLERQEAEALAAVQARAEALNGAQVTLSRKTGEEGKLFGSVGTQDIADACLFLLSDKAAWITGTELIVDGGLMALP